MAQLRIALSVAFLVVAAGPARADLIGPPLFGAPTWIGAVVLVAIIGLGVFCGSGARENKA